jgi:hypothetical protein
MAFLLRLIFSIFILTSFSVVSIAQETTRVQKGYVVVDNDTIPLYILGDFDYKDPDFEKEWNRTVYYTTRMYTYAKIIDSIVDSHEANLEKAKNANKKAKKLARKASKALKKNLWDKYSYEIKNLTDVRGDYLTRLVHRETGVTTFDLIKKYKNPQTAFFWNSVLWSFNSTNLKNEFDPKRDWMLKLVVEEIEAGKIKPVSRARQLKELKAREAYEKAKKKKK